MSVTTPLEAVVERLDQLLTEETTALRRLDSDSIEQLTERKAALLRELGGVSREGATRDTLRLVAQVREKALTNQLLLVHARDMVRGVIDRMAPSFEPHNPSGARLLQVRG